ncbi:unnamed protein product [Rhizophagus irregularis]|nr:unnamed protein product [Rhizophagus irregularis]
MSTELCCYASSTLYTLPIGNVDVKRNVYWTNFMQTVNYMIVLKVLLEKVSFALRANCAPFIFPVFAAVTE